MNRLPSLRPRSEISFIEYLNGNRRSEKLDSQSRFSARDGPRSIERKLLPRGGGLVSKKLSIETCVSHRSRVSREELYRPRKVDSYEESARNADSVQKKRKSPLRGRQSSTIDCAYRGSRVS